MILSLGLSHRRLLDETWLFSRRRRRSLHSAIAAAVSIRAAGSAPTVKIDTGKLEGKSDGTITAFLGIPFAKPPVGDLRWKPPVAPAKWKGARKATEFGSRCMQGAIYDDMIFRDPGISEDCLYLNVWTPAKLDKANPKTSSPSWSGSTAAASPPAQPPNRARTARTSPKKASSSFR